MTDVSVSSVQPSEVGPEMVAYLLTVSIVVGPEYGRSYSVSGSNVPLILGASKDEILRTYAECLRVVRMPHKVDEIMR